MGRSVAVVTSCYGDYDPLVTQPEQTIPVEWICITDGARAPDPWRTLIEPRPHLHPRMAAKLARCRPDLYTRADLTIWIDASARLHPDSAEGLVDGLGDALIAQFRHPERCDILAEAEVSKGMRKYAGQPLDAQTAHYHHNGFPGIGLWATGCIVRRTTPRIRDFGDLWLTEMWRWGWQDQISEPYALWRTGLRPVDLPGGLWSNPLVSFSYEQRRRDD